MRRYSRFNIFSRIRDSENFFIINLLTGNADILDPPEAEKVRSVINSAQNSDPEFLDELSAKGYVIDEQEESDLFRNRYLDFLDSRHSDEIQIFFVTSYSCNFACSYCYQDQYDNTGNELTEEIINSFFSFVNTRFSGRRKYITIFGGEPLLGSKKQKELTGKIIEKANESGLELSFVTNGYFLEEYSEVLEKGRIREVQVTLDGTERVNDKRRFLKGGGGSFSKIVRGIDEMLRKGITVNLRMVVDRENIDNLPELALFAINKGWTANPLFKTQIGRNYELHHCQSSPEKLFDRLSLYEKIHDLIKLYPHISEFYQPAYSVAKYLWENGELPDPLFDSCPACKTEWAFDYTGHIYSCTATVGKTGESLGTFYPSVTWKEEIVSQWEERDVTSISECTRCNVRLACGGGCGSVARNRTGKICSPDCRPVKELLELGFSAYFKTV